MWVDHIQATEQSSGDWNEAAIVARHSQVNVLIAFGLSNNLCFLIER